MKLRIAKMGLLAAIRYRRPLLRIARKATRRASDRAGGTRRAFTVAQRLSADPDVRAQVRRAASAGSRAVARTRKVGVADVFGDQRVLSELRAAAEAMASVAAASHAPKHARGRIARVGFGVGLVGAGAYAGYRAFRSQPTQTRVATPHQEPPTSGTPTTEPQATAS